MSLRAARFLVAAVLLLGACKPAPAAAKVPTRPIAEWVGEETELFDDAIDVGALPLGDAPPSRDETNEALIPRRMDLADAVVLGKVVGVHSEPVGDKKRFRLDISVEGAPLYAVDEPPRTVSIIFPPDSPSYGTVRALDARLINRKLVVFYRAYVDEDGGDPIFHFHLSPPTKAVLDAVELHKTRKQFN